MNSEYRGHFIHMWNKIYRFIFYRESLNTNRVTNIRNQQQQTAVVKTSSTAGTALFLRRNELRNEQGNRIP